MNRFHTEKHYPQYTNKLVISTETNKTDVEEISRAS